MKCEHENCKREATVSNKQYFEGKWYCTFHGNKATKEGSEILIRIRDKSLKAKVVKFPFYKG